MKAFDEQTVPEDEILDRIFTAPNIVTFIRMLLLPLFLWLLFGAKLETPALVVYAIAACTDWVDGQLARRTHQVSKLGKMLDPAVDRLLIATGIIAVYFLGRVPLWILVYLIGRDAILLIGGKIMLSTVGKVPSVVWLGKFATAFLMFGFGFLLLGMPVIAGAGFAQAPAWLPGFGNEPYFFGIWLIYAGLICSVTVFIFYFVKSLKMMTGWKRSAQ